MTSQAGRQLIVQKYGGTSVGSAERIIASAERVAALAAEGNDMVVTVSAMGKTTDQLIQLARQVSHDPEGRELDQLLVTGEQVSASLMAMALIARGRPAVSLTGAQAGIRTTRLFTKARITDIQPERLKREIAAGRIAIVTGFQGITDDQDMTTIGRGGSDTTAVALAAALKADRCEILTDVEGIYTADPRVVPKARKVDRISYEEMLELASLGARVMHPRAVELGEVYDVPILVRSSFADAPGTLITRTDNVEVRKNVRGIAHDTDVAKIRIVGVPDRPGVAAAIFNPLADAAISVDVIVQNTSLDGKTDMSFTVSRAEHARAAAIVEQIVPSIGAAGLDHSDGLAKISIVGTGMQSAPGYAARMFQALSAAGINIDMITTSDIRITCIIAADQANAAVNALHTAFALDQED
ncbi:MAG: aspartate kinase [Chloroflexi bacterium]|nr:aspartate kinase [Chloroflexota bacterium]